MKERKNTNSFAGKKPSSRVTSYTVEADGRVTNVKVEPAKKAVTIIIIIIVSAFSAVAFLPGLGHILQAVLA